MPMIGPMGLPKTYEHVYPNKKNAWIYLVSLGDLLKFLREVGFSRVAKFISFLAWFILPFWIWMIVLRFVAIEYFVLIPAIPGLALLGLAVFISTVSTPSIMNLGFKVMRSVEKTGASLFKNLADKEIAEQFKQECRKLAFGFTHSPTFMESGVVEYLRVHSFKLAWECFALIYASYSMVTVFMNFQTEIWGFLEPFVSASTQLIQSSPLSSLVEWSTYNLWVTLAFLWILSLYFDPIFSGIRACVHAVSGFRLISIYVVYSLSLGYRIVLPLMVTVFGVLHFSRRGKTVACTPFIDPLTLPQIFQATVNNVEGKSCDTLRWGEIPETKAEIESRKSLILNDKNLPSISKLFIRISRSEDVFRRIREMRPMTYVGIQDSRCVFFGTVTYNPIEKVRQARFFFDTIYLKREFLVIYEKEAEKQRQIERKIPSTLEEIARRLEID